MKSHQIVFSLKVSIKFQKIERWKLLRTCRKLKRETKVKLSYQMTVKQQTADFLY